MKKKRKKRKRKSNKLLKHADFGLIQTKIKPRSLGRGFFTFYYDIEFSYYLK